LNWIQYQDKCYWISSGIDDQKLSWFKAKEFCNSNGGYLVSVHSPRELEFVIRQVSCHIKSLVFFYSLNLKVDFKAGKTLDRWWIGLNQLTLNAGFVWSDGSPVNFINWEAGEPNGAHGSENCVEMFGGNSTWT
jgi:C-type mannose receptor